MEKTLKNVSPLKSGWKLSISTDTEIKSILKEYQIKFKRKIGNMKINIF